MAFARDVRSFLIVCITAGSIVAIFPYSALTFKGRNGASSLSASAAYVELSPEEESAALSAARTAWQSDNVSARRLRVRLPLGELPEEPEGPFFGMNADGVRDRGEPMPVAYTHALYVPLPMTEDMPHSYEVEEAQKSPAFSREDLLNLK